MSSGYFTSMPGRSVSTGTSEMFVVESGSGIPVVFIHGLGWTHALWHRLIPVFAQRYRIIAADTRGHGRSAKPPGPYTMDMLAADWLALLDACGVQRCAVVGVSQGGMIAMLLALRHPERVTALGLLSTSCRFSDEAWSAMEERGRVLNALGPVAAAEHVSKAIFSSDFHTKNPALMDEFVRDRIEASAEGIGAATMSLRGFDVSGEIPQLKCPIFMMHGDADRVISPVSAQTIRDAAPHARIVMVEGAGHILPVERHDSVERQLGQFLDSNYLG